MAEPSKESKVTVDLDKDKTPTQQPRGDQQPQDRQQPQSGQLTRFDELERDMERIFENFMSRGFVRPFRDLPSFRDFPSFRGLDLSRTPKVDLVERDEDVLVRAELPGVDKNNIQVTLTDRALTIRATTRKEDKEEKGDYYRREI